MLRAHFESKMRVPHLLGLYTGPLGGLDLRVGVIGDGTPSLRGRRADWGGSSHGPLVRCTASSGTRAQIHPFGGRVPTRSSPRVCRSRSSVASTPGRSTWSPRAPPTTRPERANEQTQDTGGWWRARVQLAVREMVAIAVRPIQAEGRFPDPGRAVHHHHGGGAGRGSAGVHPIQKCEGFPPVDQDSGWG